MKTITFISLFLILILGNNISAQETSSPERFGHTLNLGVGIGYYGYIGHSLPVLHADYEFQVANNFTIAPFMTIYSYQDYYYWGDHNNPYKNYSYRETAIPLGIKGAYYFDKLLNASPKWDFYLAASLGFVVRTTMWENGYYGETAVISNETSGLYLDGHIGAEYHITGKTGLFLDLSTGASTFGLAIHL